MNKDKRFQVTYKEGGIRVIVDCQTGVNYIYMNSGYGGGITPLLDRDGKFIITSTTGEEAYL